MPCKNPKIEDREEESFASNRSIVAQCLLEAGFTQKLTETLLKCCQLRINFLWYIIDLYLDMEIIEEFKALGLTEKQARALTSTFLMKYQVSLTRQFKLEGSDTILDGTRRENKYLK